MSKVLATPPEVKAVLTTGFDPDKIPWETVLVLVRWFFSLFATKEVTPAMLKAAHPDCPLECCEHCCRIMERSLANFMDAHECCEKCRVPTS